MDVKPDNVLVEVRPGILTPRLIDFGIARDLNSSGGPANHGDVGTPGYMAPEISPDHRPDSAADVYGLGQTMHEMATGRTADRDSNLPRVRPPEVPPSLWSVIENCLSTQSVLRPTAADAATTLRSLLADHRLRSQPGPTQHPVTVISSSRTKPVTTTGWRAATAIPARSTRWIRQGGKPRTAVAAGAAAVAATGLLWIGISLIADDPKPTAPTSATKAAATTSSASALSSPALAAGIPESAGWACGPFQTQADGNFSYQACVGADGDQLFGWLHVTDILTAESVKFSVEIAGVPNAQRQAYQTCVLNLDPGETADCGPIEALADAESQSIVFGGMVGSNNQTVGIVQSPPCLAEEASEPTQLTTSGPEAGTGC
jgi:hypothetical protein